MDTNFATQLALSILFFAPGILLFAGLAFVGVLMILEKAVFQPNAQQALTATKLNLELPAAANPVPGPIVTALKDAQQPHLEQEKRRANK